MLTAVIIDDEKLAVEYLKTLLIESKRVEVLAGFVDSRTALAAFEAGLVADVVFLDIDMPALNGFELAERLPANIEKVFVTAYDDKALHAFEIHAAGYVCKPLSNKRIEETIDRLENITGKRSKP